MARNTKNNDTHNLAKLKILVAVQVCQERNIAATSYEITKLTGKSRNAVLCELHHLSETWPYLKKKYATRAHRWTTPKTRKEKKERRQHKDKKPETRATFVYTLSPEGESVLRKLSERYEQGLELNLRRKNPKKLKIR